MKSILFVLLSAVTVCFAQNEPQVDDLQESLVTYKAESAEYTDRINKLLVQLKITDANLESNIARTLEFTKRYTDSADTGERIMKGKESILRDLMKSIKKYSGLQKDIVREVTMDRNYVKEDMINIRDWVDEKIKLRVKQITEITTSLGGYNYYSRGGYSGGDYYDDDGAAEERLADDAAKTKKSIVRDIRQGIEVLSKRSEKLEKELSNIRAKRPLEDINNDLTAVNEKIAVLENSIDDIYSEETHGKRVGKDGSREIQKEMRKRVSKLKSSSTSFFKSFDAMMRMLRRQKALNITIEKYEFAIEQLNTGS
jgi:predicted  nucleic acid-binding Zn-ribbon protein